jgi:ribonuclease D
MTRKLSLTAEGRNVSVYLHKGDLPDSATFSGPVAVDSETMGLSLVRDPLCLVQLSDGGAEAHLVQLNRQTYDAPNLKRVLSDPNRLKLLHFARFDLAMFMRDLSVVCAPVYCTKVASKLVRTYTDKHGLKDLTKEVLGRDLTKDQQSSDWGAAELSDAQLAYAASDVLHLHALKARLDEMLAREGRTEIAQACFDFLPTRAALDLAGWEEVDIFAHS